MTNIARSLGVFVFSVNKIFKYICTVFVVWGSP